MNIKYITRITKQRESPIAHMTFHSNSFYFEENLLMQAPTKALFILPESIPITPLFGITEFDSSLISRHFKNRGSVKNCLPEIKAAAKLY